MYRSSCCIAFEFAHLNELVYNSLSCHGGIAVHNIAGMAALAYAVTASLKGGPQAEIRSLLKERIAAGEDVVVDLADVTFTDSEGLGALVAAVLVLVMGPVHVQVRVFVRLVLVRELAGLSFVERAEKRR